ncbi:hypothetical protein M501DRAFT_987768 [Patellaria atrata CBS 101060]|uniref:VanZ-like domain-containing protein n=1 Tax=Patellaria atrata CBS 101060 TaxID=1346257 RepID=A0A9P4VPS7_9PEZI|nr:hypothetical protein M501DRAFT_987768 [Patellaria atrata CBS 101060]
MRIRTPFAAGFVVLLFLSGFAGLAPSKLPLPGHSDKGLHFVTFLILTLCFYWIIDTSRRRVIQFTLFACTFVLSIGSEIAQGLLPNGRDFDPYDIVANVLGSLIAVGACNWYHKRMLERKRKARGYHNVATDDLDVELGEGVGGQESGVIPEPTRTVDEELDNWDENAEDWDEREADSNGDSIQRKGTDGVAM